MIVYGRNVILEALKGDYPIFEIRVASGSKKELEGILRLAQTRGIKTKLVSKDELSAWVKSQEHQGIGAIIQDIPEHGLEIFMKDKNDNSLIVVLDGVLDPRNLGAILRTALASGAQGVVVPKDRSASLSASAIKASAGAGLFLPVVKVTNLARAIEELKRDGFWAYGASVKDGCSLYEIDWADKALIVVGGEGSGLRRLVKEKCDVLFSIPMWGSVESLNVSVAAGVTLFEYRRKKCDVKSGFNVKDFGV